MAGAWYLSGSRMTCLTQECDRIVIYINQHSGLELVILHDRRAMKSDTEY
jgi:hypothetical protein